MKLNFNNILSIYNDTEKYYIVCDDIDQYLAYISSLNSVFDENINNKECDFILDTKNYQRMNEGNVQVVDYIEHNLDKKGVLNLIGLNDNQMLEEILNFLNIKDAAFQYMKDGKIFKNQEEYCGSLHNFIIVADNKSKLEKVIKNICDEFYVENTSDFPLLNINNWVQSNSLSDVSAISSILIKGKDSFTNKNIVIDLNNKKKFENIIIETYEDKGVTFGGKEHLYTAHIFGADLNKDLIILTDEDWNNFYSMTENIHEIYKKLDIFDHNRYSYIGHSDKSHYDGKLEKFKTINKRIDNNDEYIIDLREKSVKDYIDIMVKYYNNIKSKYDNKEIILCVETYNYERHYFTGNFNKESADKVNDKMGEIAYKQLISEYPDMSEYGDTYDELSMNGAFDSGDGPDPNPHCEIVNKYEYTDKEWNEILEEAEYSNEDRIAEEYAMKNWK